MALSRAHTSAKAVAKLLLLNKCQVKHTQCLGVGTTQPTYKPSVAGIAWAPPNRNQNLYPNLNVTRSGLPLKSNGFYRATFPPDLATIRRVVLA